MSFLNPVNEPVLRFSSKDAGAPQINYNARVAGDIKTVLKACLVTGYGTKASAGWTMPKETGNIAEFASPVAAMSDYKLGIDDRSAATSTWYYLYKTSRTNPNYNIPTKQINAFDKSSVKNGWQLLVTMRGIILIEIFDSNIINELVSRVTYWGQIKSGLKNNTGVNMAFWQVGFGGAEAFPAYFFDPINPNYRHFRFGTYINDINVGGSNVLSMSSQNDNADSNAAVEVASALYLYRLGRFMGEQPALIMTDNNDPLKRYGVFDTTFQERPAINLCLAYDFNDLPSFPNYTKTILLYLDYWEY